MKILSNLKKSYKNKYFRISII